MKTRFQVLSVSCLGFAVGVSVVAHEAPWIVFTIGLIFTLGFIGIYGLLFAAVRFVGYLRAKNFLNSDQTQFSEHVIGVDIDNNPLMEHNWHNGGK